MNYDLQSLIKRFSEWYGSLERRQKRNLIAIGIFFLLTVSLLSLFLLNPNYQVVFSNLNSKSAGEITQKLDQLKIPYQLQGNTILIPSAQADQARIDMAMNGLPSTGMVDYSQILQNSSPLGMTDQAMNLEVLSVLQTRLAQSIELINGISNAQVNIVMPQSSSFLVNPTQSGTAKASVILNVAPGNVLTSSQVFGIQQLVAHSVTGLSAADVSVIDQNGNDLSASTGSSGAAISGQVAQEIAIKQQIETTLAMQLQNSLTQFVGAGNVQVIVHANVTFNSEVQSSHVVTAGPPLSSQTSTSSSTGGGTGGGVAGQATQNPNVVTYGSTGGGTGATSNTRSSTTNYENSNTNTTTKLDPMQVNGYNVSVLINAKAVALTPTLSANLQQFVLTAVGARGAGAKGSAVSVLTVPFVNSSLTGTVPSSFVTPLALGAVGALVLGGILIFIIRRRKRPDPVTAQRQLLGDDNTEQSPEAMMTRQLQEMAFKKPEAMASLIRTWLSDD
ncbi:flagellar basal-body MS-ring/collar protein FliF [Ferroacidibacillus organovorans]|uniref:Flagellar M-ring protein n=1 Tax=Ferroacidibacillus organovorans TaxID=1765683 RepID=A0A1V4ES09_9BACL|nr:flagellar basal-body MS-ring/collar protein FliF [Ferroacidibacillus organovorans]OPG15681.1 flagellar M-ring protein FliF [Ferroacidibacillus organovorans]